MVEVESLITLLRAKNWSVSEERQFVKRRAPRIKENNLIKFNVLNFHLALSKLIGVSFIILKMGEREGPFWNLSVWPNFKGHMSEVFFEVEVKVFKVWCLVS